MPDLRVRDFGTIVPGDQFSAAVTAEPPAQAVARGADEPAPGPGSPILVADVAGDTDLLGLGAAVAVLAALAVHRRVETPFAIGLFGPRGSGRSTVLRLLLQAITAARSRARAEAPGKLPLVEIDAARLDGPTVVALADHLHASLAESCPGLVAEAIHASRDARLAAREAFEALDAARRKLSGERLALENEEARRAGLAESVLFEAAGTRIDAYARANRGRLRKRLAGLGLRDEPIRAFKQLVHQAADGAAARFLFVLRSLWAYRGQATLLGLAIFAVLAGFALDYAEAERAAWLGRLREADSTRATADWLEANIGLLDTARQILFAGAGLAVAIDLLRAAGLIFPVFRGCSLLKEDLALRQRLADEEFGHEARRVESLAAEVEALARRAAEAERRAAEARPAAAGLVETSPFVQDPKKRQAERFIAAIARLVATKGRSRPDAAPRMIEAPERIVIALDGLDAVAAARAGEILATAHAAFGAGFVVLVAVDPAGLEADVGRSALESWIQVPFQVGELTARGNVSAVVRTALDRAPAAAPSQPAPADPPIEIDTPITETEADLLAALAPLAGSSPRAVKRFVNLYRIARLLCPDDKAMLALMLALDAGGTAAEVAACAEALDATGRDRLDLESLGAEPRLAAALVAVRESMGDESLAGARRAAETARLFSFGRRR